MSDRSEELLEKAYAYVQQHGFAELSLRPLASAIGSSPRVLIFLFGSKDGLVRALLARARRDELALLDGPPATLGEQLRRIWAWLAAAEHRGLLTAWCEAYSRSLAEEAPQPDPGPWAGFAAQTVADWLELLRRAQPAARRRTRAGEAERTLALAVLRGALLDVLATGDVARTTAAVELAAAQLEGAAVRS